MSISLPTIALCTAMSAPNRTAESGCRIESETVPISIEGLYYPADQFIQVINRGYLKAKRYEQGRPLFQRFLSRSETPSITMLALLRRCYSSEAPERFNGLAVWEGRFNDFIEKKASAYSEGDSDRYLRDILVAPLRDFVETSSDLKASSCALKRGSKERINAIACYQDYVEACIDVGYLPKLDIRWQAHCGWSLFAVEPIYPFMFLGLYGGVIRLTQWVRLLERLRCYKNRYKWSLYNNEHFLIDAETVGSHARFINHDAKKTGRVGVVSLHLNASVEGRRGSREDPVLLPQRGLIAARPEPRQTPSKYVFDAGEEVVWCYGPKVLFS